jgi:hypothetical protein
MIDCSIHGLTPFHLGCAHFEHAVETRTPIPVVGRLNDQWQRFLLCDACAVRVDATRGVSNSALESGVGMEEFGKNLACARCMIETYEQAADPNLVGWFRLTYAETYAKMRADGLLPPKDDP